VSDVELTPSLVENSSLERWISFQGDHTVRVATGKVEIGQGILTALAQIAAEELDVELGTVQVLSGSTTYGPNEQYTTSSLSVEVSGGSIRLVCAQVRARMLDRMAQRLNCDRDALSINNGSFMLDGKDTGFDYWRIAPEVDLVSPVSGAVQTKKPADYRVVGSSVPRLDLPAKVSGAAFIHDMTRADMLHARTLRQPTPGATLQSIDEAAISRAARGEVRFVRIANFVAFVADDEAVVERAAAAAPEHASWSGVEPLDPALQHAQWLQGKPSKLQHIGSSAPPASGESVVEASYSRPHIAHAAMGPSCALAEMRDGQLTIWSHGQGMHPLRTAVAKAMDLDVEAITAHHVQGPGCYGHNGADDAALDAALIAREIPGHCIRVQWRREEEFGFEPFGTAMQVNLRVAVDGNGSPVDWTTELWSAVHVQRPGPGGRLLATSALGKTLPKLEVADPPESRGGGATRNAIPLYDLPAHRVEHHLVPDVALRTSALRGLGALPNVYAIESMMDELALLGDRDPLEYRLSILSEPRARRILEQVAKNAGWINRGPAGTGKGLGIAMARYKNRAAYAAVVVALEVAETVTLSHVWCVTDAGLVVNPNGAINQLEGGIVQGASWALREEVTLDESGVTSLNWDRYPILRFSEIPPIDVEIVDSAEQRTLGVGECTVGPTAAAIGNAVAHALGARIRAMPLTRERIAAALLA
jgi:CO/xanthine dehydrogenase Mo-binding subunit